MSGRKRIKPPFVTRHSKHGVAIEELRVVKTPKDCEQDALDRFARYRDERKVRRELAGFSTDELYDAIDARRSA